MISFFSPYRQSRYGLLSPYFARWAQYGLLAPPISLSLNTATLVRYFARWAQYAHVGLFLPPLEKKLLQKKKLLDTPDDYAYKPPSPTG